MPTMWQAGAYPSIVQYPKAIQATGSNDSKIITAKMRATPIDDFFSRHDHLRTDGLMVHDLSRVQVKTPEASKYPWDYYKILAATPGARAFPLPHSTAGAELSAAAVRPGSSRHWAAR
jgi:branched-chain amino acid transport system substrate-binding protein